MPINPTDIHNPHDKGYKVLLSSEKVFLELLQSFVTCGWVQKIDAESMTRIENSYIFRDFNEVEADLVYRLKFKGQDVIFYLLIELQSTVDFQMPYRLLEYMVGIWRDVVKKTETKVVERKDYRLPAIVPIVLYNGAGRWTACRSFKETLAEAEQFNEYLVDFKYILIDVNRYDKKVLLDLSNLIGTVFLLDQSISQEEYLRRLGELGIILKKFDAKSFRSFAIWFKDISSSILPDKSREEMCRILDQYTIRGGGASGFQYGTDFKKNV